MSSANDIHRVDTIGRGFLAIMAHPASSGDPAATLARVAAAGVQQVISLLEPEEAAALGLQREAQLAAENSMGFVSFPVPDMGLPESVEPFARLSLMLYRQVESGVNSLIHCRAGIGRSGLLAAAVLMHGGLDAPRAFAQVAGMRGAHLPETPAQGSWLARHGPAIVAPGARPVTGIAR